VLVADNFTTLKCQLSLNLGASTFWNLQDLSRHVQGLLYLYRGGFREWNCRQKKSELWVWPYGSNVFSKLVLLSVEMLSKGRTLFGVDQRAIPISCYTYYVPDVVFLSRPELVICVRNITAANVVLSSEVPRLDSFRLLIYVEATGQSGRYFF